MMAPFQAPEKQSIPLFVLEPLFPGRQQNKWVYIEPIVFARLRLNNKCLHTFDFAAGYSFSVRDSSVVVLLRAGLDPHTSFREVGAFLGSLEWSGCCRLDPDSIDARTQHQMLSLDPGSDASASRFSLKLSVLALI